MQINAPSSLLQILLASQAKRAAAAPLMPDQPSQPAPVPGTVGTPAQSVQMLVTLAAATIPPDVERRRRVAKEAEKALDALEMLQAALVVGVGAAEPARTLRSWLEERPHPEDPRLAEIVDEIDLRIQVELAKLERE